MTGIDSVRLTDSCRLTSKIFSPEFAYNEQLGLSSPLSCSFHLLTFSYTPATITRPVMSCLTAVFLTASAVYASVTPTHGSHTEDTPLHKMWYHEDNHPVHALFKRGPVDDGVPYSAIGTPGKPWSLPRFTSGNQHSVFRMVCRLPSRCCRHCVSPPGLGGCS
jgi:hypothetical protein